jgi:hypothetical protein
MHNGQDRRRRVKVQGPATNQTPEIGSVPSGCGVEALDRIP